MKSKILILLLSGILLTMSAAGESSLPPSQPPAENRVVILEFSDFQCPFCAKAVPMLNKIKETYGDKVEIVFEQFPLSFHLSVQNASEASECVRLITQ